MKLIIFRVVSIVLAVLSMAFIYYNSSETAEQSSLRSNKVTDIVAEVIVENYDKLPEVQKVPIRKKISVPLREVAHALEFCLLGFFAFLSFYSFLMNKKIYLSLIFTFALCLIWAVLDEFHQTFVSGRGAELFDILMDSIGALVGLGVSFLIVFIVNKSKKKKSAKNQIS